MKFTAKELHNAFYGYTSPSHAHFDQAFTEEIRSLRPDWFNPKKKLEDSKAEILALAKAGEAKPHYKTRLGTALHKFLRRSGPTADPEFKRALHKLRPDWFVNQQALRKKQKLLAMARAGVPQPRLGDKMFFAFRSYRTRSSSAYDAEFTLKIRQLRPDWLHDRRHKK